MKSQTLWLLVAQVSCVILQQLPSLLSSSAVLKPELQSSGLGLGGGYP